MSNLLPELPPGAFNKVDAAEDEEFYAPPRLVTHIDENAIAALGQFYRNELPAGGAILDLMSSWVSHLPADVDYGEVVGQGMNAEELAANPRLTRWFVQNLNREPVLPLEDQHFDAAMCCVSVQYLQQPVEVFSEVKRVLKPEAPFIVSFSNRCFPTKAVAIWRSLDMQRQASLILLYLEKAGFSGGDVAFLADGATSDPLVAAVGWR
jgi:SAM-dependent methyltransferase